MLFQGIFAQDFTLILRSRDSTETKILNRLIFKSRHAKESLVYKEIKSITTQIQKLGYFSNILEELIKKDSVITAQFSFGPKTNRFIVFVPEKIQNHYAQFSFIHKDSISLIPSEIEKYIQGVLQEFDQSGKSFAELQLTNPKLVKDKLFFTLSIKESQKRTIDKVTVTDFQKFPTAFIKKYFKIDSDKLFSKDALEEISRATKSLNFVEEIKPPEVLFKKDSTIVYLFLNKKKNSKVDGILNLASKEDGNGVLLNGNIDLRLGNTLNTGEEFNLYWNKVKEETSEFRINTYFPYAFNTSFSPEMSFDIYRQDSTFLTTSFELKVDYQISQNSKVFLGYRNEVSNYLLDNIDLKFDSFSKNFLNIGFSYKLPSDSPKYDYKINSEIIAGFGKRKITENLENQLNIEFHSEINIDISSRHYLYINNVTGYLKSKTFLTNELFRLGGANSLRGFNEQSIFTDQFSYFNIEYRYLTSNDSFLHTITDFGIEKKSIDDVSKSLIGLGLGYLFSIDNNQIKLGYALGVKPGENFDFNQSKLIVRFISQF